MYRMISEECQWHTSKYFDRIRVSECIGPTLENTFRWQRIYPDRFGTWKQPSLTLQNTQNACCFF